MSQNPTQVSRRYCDMKFGHSHPKSYSPSKRERVLNLKSNRYFCHYQNAIYMGGIDCYKKHGNGILFMDSGACIICNFRHDKMDLHNLIFKDKSFMSILYLNNHEQLICYRTNRYLLSLNFKNCCNYSKGNGYFIDFKEERVYKIGIQKEQVIKKIQVRDHILNQMIFYEHNYRDVVSDQRQIKALNFIFDLPKDIKCIRKGQELTIGFIQEDHKSKKFVNNGLLFKLAINTDATNFDVSLLQRGYFKGDKMQKFGQKHFQNQNYYIGGFKNGEFHGLGVLITPQHQKWTMGRYYHGQLDTIVQSSVSGNMRISQILKKLHQNQDPYIQTKIKLFPSSHTINTILSSSINQKITQEISIDKQSLKRKKKYNLSVVNNDYISGRYQHRTEEIIKEQLSNQRKKCYRGGSGYSQEKYRTPGKYENQNQDEEISSRIKTDMRNQRQKSIEKQSSDFIKPINIQPKHEPKHEPKYQPKHQLKHQPKHQLKHQPKKAHKKQKTFQIQPTTYHYKQPKTYQLSKQRNNNSIQNYIKKINEKSHPIHSHKYNLSASPPRLTPYIYKYTADPLLEYSGILPNYSFYQALDIQNNFKGYIDPMIISRQRKFKYIQDIQDDQLRLYGY